MHIDMPEDVHYIIDTLDAAGFEGYAVGGCVRDSLLGRTPADWDITTSAEPGEVKSLFPHTIDTGIQHGTVTVLMPDIPAEDGSRRWKGYEVTTYRIDGKYADGRHPDQVTFTPSLEEDLKRRDFTINAMAYNDRAGLVDLFGGQEDLKPGIIRCVGDPKQRFSEDSLRMLRAVRFAAQLGFALEPSVREAIRADASSLSRVSAERIQVELVKLVTSPHPEEIEEACNCGLTAVFLPEFDEMMRTPQHTPHHSFDVGHHTIEVMKNVPPEKILRLAALLHDVGKPACRTTDATGRDHFKGHPQVGAPMARKILRRLKFDNDTTDRVVQLVQFHDERPSATERSVRRAMVRIGRDAFPEIFTLKRADTLGQSMYHRAEKLQAIDDFERLYHEILKKQEALSVKDLKIDGKDLLTMGVPQGAEIGRILKQLLEEVVDEPERNTREYQMQRAREIAQIS